MYPLSNSFGHIGVYLALQFQEVVYPCKPSAFDPFTPPSHLSVAFRMAASFNVAMLKAEEPKVGESQTWRNLNRKGVLFWRVIMLW